MEERKKILFASNNRGKYDELVQDFYTVGFELVYDGNLNLPETSNRLSENAYTKAAAAAKEKGMVALGDDSGIFIEALDYFPGVYSRRWFGDENDDHSRNQQILRLMKDEDDRTAYLISRFSLVDPNGKELFNTKVENKFYISREELGTNGFGYDNILIPSEEMVKRINTTDCFTIGTYTQEEKNIINNRGRIAKELELIYTYKCD